MKNTKFYKALVKIWTWFCQTSFWKGCVKLRDTLKPMNWRQRLDFLWTYYKDIVAIVLVVMIIPISLIASVAGKKDVIFGGTFVNLDLRKSGLEYIRDDLFEKIGGDPKTQKVEVGGIYFQEVSNQPEYNYNTAMSVFAAIDADTVDYLFLDTYALEFYMGDLIYMDLRLLFSEAELAEMGTNVIYLLDDETYERTPVALNVTEIPFIQDCVRKDESEKTEDEKEKEFAVYLTFVGPFEEAEQYRDFWDYLMAWEGMPEEASLG